MHDRQSAAFKFVFKLFRALLNNMEEAHGGQELVGVVDSGVVEAKSEKECVVQTFKVSSKLWCVTRDINGIVRMLSGIWRRACTWAKRTCTSRSSR